MTTRLAVLTAVLVAALAVVLTLAAVTLRRGAPLPAGLHTVWCVKRGYPPDLAMPVITGPGTGLAGCPLGEVQVSEP